MEADMEAAVSLLCRVHSDPMRRTQPPEQQMTNKEQLNYGFPNRGHRLP